jgi:hypothetical protein
LWKRIRTKSAGDITRSRLAAGIGLPLDGAPLQERTDTMTGRTRRITFVALARKQKLPTDRCRYARASKKGVQRMRTFEGGCHCGRVRFRITADLTHVAECNCSICTKKGFLHLIVPPERFELLRAIVSTRRLNPFRRYRLKRPS